MCLALYIASDHDLALTEGPDLRIEHVEESCAAIRHWFSRPHVRHLGSHHGCGCGFPSAIADEPIEYYDGMFDDEDPERARDLQSVRALFAVIEECLRNGPAVELLAVWNGDVYAEPPGVVEARIGALDPATFFFTEGFLYRITADSYSATFIGNTC